MYLGLSSPILLESSHSHRASSHSTCAFVYYCGMLSSRYNPSSIFMVGAEMKTSHNLRQRHRYHGYLPCVQCFGQSLESFEEDSAPGPGESCLVPINRSTKALECGVRTHCGRKYLNWCTPFGPYSQCNGGSPSAFCEGEIVLTTLRENGLCSYYHFLPGMLEEKIKKSFTAYFFFLSDLIPMHWRARRP